MGRTSLAALYSRHLEMSRCQSPRVDMPLVGVLQLVLIFLGLYSL
jgi:hypothetical protein